MEAYEAQKKLIPHAKVIFDVGAYIGDVTHKYLTMYSDADVWAFEPNPESYDKLRERYNMNPRVFHTCGALSDVSGEKMYFSNRAAYTGSLLSVVDKANIWVKSKELTPAEKYNVDTMTIDEVCHLGFIERIDILKLDTQGSELMVLQGAKSLLARHAIGLIYTEVMFVPIYSQQAKFHDMCAFLDAYGYQFYNIYDIREHYGRAKWADVIFV